MPSEKRQRQRARKQSMAQLRMVQMQKRRRTRVLLSFTGLALAALVIAVLVSVFAGGSKPTKLQTASKSTTTTKATTSTSSKSSATTTPPVSVPLLTAPKTVGCPATNGSSPRYTRFSAVPPTCIDASKTYTATMVTDAGTITIQLLPKVAPLAVNNMYFLAGYHFYDGTSFHRVIPGFVDQGGDPTGTGTGGPGYQFKDELPSSNSVYAAGALAMANSGPNTNGSQFFIVVGNGGKQLQPLYTYFGKVTAGMSVVDKINTDGTTSGTPKVVHKIVKLTVTAS